jgi:methylmalonyl-CoA mutase
MVRKQQLAQLDRIKSRDTEKYRNYKKLIDCGKELTRNSRRRWNRTTLGEISALETVYGRYKAQIKSFSGVYSKEIKDDKSFEKAKQIADIFATGRTPP